MNSQKSVGSVDSERWYSGISRYQWLVLIIASAGWVFDVYESQIFNITRADVLTDLGQSESQVKMLGDWFLAVFLVGGTIGGLLFGSLADRFGRGPIMIVTILVYSIFSGLTYFVDSLWQLTILRLVISIGIGGEWAVAAALVAEVFPSKARSHASAIFHASSVLGTWLAAIAGILVGANWRLAYVLGVLPALLVIWVRASIREPEQWRRQKASNNQQNSGSFLALFSDSTWRRHAVLGMLLAAVGLGTFWSVTVEGQNLVNEILKRTGQTENSASTAKFAYGIVQATGGGIGLLAFGPLAARWGRKRTFYVFHLLAVIIVPIVCWVPQSYHQLLLLLPVYGFLTMGMHSGYAVYFPELFPTYLRATGTSFCFNGGRLAAVPVLLLSGYLKQMDGLDLRVAICGLSLIYLFGIALLRMLPETVAKELPE
ncbi:MAG: MFS transporter [Planctomycetales bacterium]|nr:MFS transporter [Planctomycetales bacterium]